MELINAIERQDEELALELINLIQQQDEKLALELIDKTTALNIIYGSVSPLMACCVTGMKNIATKLMSKENININLQNKEHGYTALHFSCIENDVWPKYEDIAILLIDNGADLYLTDRDQKDSLYFIYKNNATKVMEHLQFTNRRLFYESINECGTIVCKSFSNPIADLHVVDIIVEYSF